MKTANKAASQKAKNAVVSPDAVFPGTGVGAIPDSTVSGQYGTPLVVSFNVSGVSAAISGVSVDMTLTHTWIGDLDVVLAAPGGSPSIPVFTRVGSTTATGVGDSSNLGGTYTFNDASTGNLWTTATATACGTDCIIPAGGYRTSAALTGAPTNLTLTFSGLTAAQANGTWTLTFRDGAAGDVGTVTASNLQILTGGPTPTPPATPTPTPTPVPGALQDGGFEQNVANGAVVTNPFWTSTSTAFTTSLCTTAACGTGGGTAPPRTGNGWVWFDGAADTAAAAEQGTVQQAAIIPVGATTLSYYLRVGRANAPNNSTLTVSIDGTVLQTITEPAVAETAYTERTVNISAFANGASHTILFSYNRPGANGDSFLVDDVALVGGTPPTPTPTPTGTATPTPTATPTVTPSPTVTPTPGTGNTFPGTGVGAIPDSTVSGQYGTPLVVSFNVTGQTTSPNNVSVDMTLTHTWIGDLDVVLAAPGGSPSIPVFTRVGSTTATGVGDSSNLGGTYTFNDASTGNLWTTATATACGTDCIIPAGGYRTSAALTGAPTNLTLTFSGLTAAQANGTWTLTFRDGAAGDVGTVTAANLSLGGGTPTPTPTPTVSPTPTPSPGGTSTAGYGILALTTTNQLLRFNSNYANSLTDAPLVSVGPPVQITGLATGENILGIDFRPATGQLYGLSSASRLYTINTVTGAVTNVGTAGSFTLNGANFGFDFNPTVDRIRVVSDTGQNLRLNPNDGTITATDANLNGAATGADAAGYTNSFANSTATTLYDISSTTDTLYTQNPPNAGTLVTVGALGVNITGVNGFDIANAGNLALGAFQVQGATTSGLYNVNLTTGAATLISPINSANPIRGLAITFGSPATTTLDFDGDGRADLGISRPTGGANAIYYSNSNSVYSSSEGVSYVAFGASTDIFTPGDYDGDGRTDVAVWRPSNGTFYVLQSSTNTTVAFAFGANGDRPAARDYDGDGKTDYAVVRPANGVLTWYYRSSLTGAVSGTAFGAATDVIAPGDYDGDGRFDLAVYRNGTFYVQRSSAGFTSAQFGTTGDRVVPGDYDGDGKTDYAVIRNTGSAFVWYILRSSNNSVTGVTLGASPHLPVQNDYDGDGKTDVAVWVPANGNFYIIQSSNGATVQIAFGQNGDYPIANYNNF